MNDIASYLANFNHPTNIYQPQLFRLSDSVEKAAFKELFEKAQVEFVHDEIYTQLQELVKSQNPAIRIKADEYADLITRHLAGRDIQEYGVWVYYPWSKRLVHLLDENEFVEVRTNRNQYKITRDEQRLLNTKKVGVIGLSVGQSIALTMAMERTFGEIRLADFDTAELSNLNRIRTGIHNLGLNKTVLAAREIAEIDPFLKVRIFNDGLHAGNIDNFFLENGKLDLLVEVCDGLDIKIESRYKARSLQIPVVMDTNDRGMLDVERFDLEPNRAVLHGLADGLSPDNIKGLTNEQKIPYILKMIGAETISTRLKASMLEVEQSINTWPQLASSVTLGGALTTDVCRRILLDQYHDSGRYYIDLEELVKDEKPAELQKHSYQGNPYLPLERSEMEKLAEVYLNSHTPTIEYISDDALNSIVDAALIAPSAGNNQPWKWLFKNEVLFLFHDKHRSWSWGDYYEMGSHMALGAALENLHLQAGALSLKDNVQLFPFPDQPQFIAAVSFTKLNAADPSATHLAKHLYTRNTNRKLGTRQLLNATFFELLHQEISEFAGIKFYYTESEAELDELSEIIAECDKVRLLHQLGHEEFYHEIRWNRAEAEHTKDGVELASVDISQGEIAGFKVAGDWKAVKLLAEWNQGNAFKKLSTKSVKAASAIIVFTIPEFTHSQLINVGMAVEKAWISANEQGVSVHPMLSPAFFFSRLIHGHAEDIPVNVAANLHLLRNRFLNIFHIPKGSGHEEHEVFLMKVAIADHNGITSLRKDKSELFYKD